MNTCLKSSSPSKCACIQAVLPTLQRHCATHCYWILTRMLQSGCCRSKAVLLCQPREPCKVTIPAQLQSLTCWASTCHCRRSCWRCYCALTSSKSVARSPMLLAPCSCIRALYRLNQKQYISRYMQLVPVRGDCTNGTMNS